MLTSISEFFFLFLPSVINIDVYYHAKESFYSMIQLKMMLNYFVMLNIVYLKRFPFSNHLPSSSLKYYHNCYVYSRYRLTIIYKLLSSFVSFENICLSSTNENSHIISPQILCWSFYQGFMKINSNYSYSSLPSKPLSLLPCLPIPFFFFCILAFLFQFSNSFKFSTHWWTYGFFLSVYFSMKRRIYLGSLFERVVSIVERKEWSILWWQKYMGRTPHNLANQQRKQFYDRRSLCDFPHFSFSLLRNRDGRLWSKHCVNEFLVYKR